MGDRALPPPVVWAQRGAVVFLTINLEDVKDPVIKINSDSIYFKGIGGVEKKLYEVTITLYKEIDTEKSRSFNRGRIIEFILLKKNPTDPYWPHLTADKGKQHWLKCDFDKWQDEDQSDGERDGSGGDFEEMMRRMGGLGGAASGDAKRFDFDDENEPESDSDDDHLPGLE